MPQRPEESLLANVPAELRARPEAQQAAELVVALQGEAAKGDPFEAFAALDELPAEVVRAVLAPWTGAPPDPEALDEATRRAHGFPPPPIVLRVQRAMRPLSAAALEAIGPLAAEQVRIAGVAWDGQDLRAHARMADDGSEASFGGTLEVRWFSDAATGARVADVLTYKGDSGTVFLAGTTVVVGQIAYGVVEARDARLRTALQAALVAPVTVEDVAAPERPVVAERPAPAVAEAVAAARQAEALREGVEDVVKMSDELAEELEELSAEVEELAARMQSVRELEAVAEEEAPTVRVTKKKAAAGAKKKAAAGAKKKAAVAKTPKKKAAAGAKKKAAVAKTPKKKAAVAKAPKKVAGAKKKAATAQAPKKAAAGAKKKAAAAKAPKKAAAGTKKKAATAKAPKKAAAGAKKASAKTAAGGKKTSTAKKSSAKAKK